MVAERYLLQGRDMSSGRWARKLSGSLASQKSGHATTSDAKSTDVPRALNVRVFGAEVPGYSLVSSLISSAESLIRTELERKENRPR